MKSIISFLLSLNLFFLFVTSISTFDIKSLTFSEFQEELAEYDISEGVTYKISYSKGEITQNYIRITATPTDDTPVFMYFSHLSEQRNDASLFTSKAKESVTLYVNKGFTTEQADGTFWLSVGCYAESCSFEMEVITMDEIDLAKDDSYTYFTTDKKNTVNTFKILRIDEQEDKDGYITCWATGNKNVKMTMKYIQEDTTSGETKETEIETVQHPNGRITFFKESDYPIEQNTNTNDLNALINYFIIEVTSDANSLITVGAKISLPVSDTKSINAKFVERNSKERQGVLNDLLAMDCFDMDFSVLSITEKIYLQIIDYQKSIEVNMISKSDGSITKTLQLPDGMETIEINSDYNNNFVCFKKNTDSSIEKSAMYSFQLTDLERQGVYSNIFTPQVGGYSYVRYLKPGKAAFYTGLPNKSFNTEYRFNLKVIEGYPKMYFVKCKTFPKCDFDPEKISPEDTITPHDVNGMFTYSLYKTEVTLPTSGEQYILYSYCQTDGEEEQNNLGCKFETSFFTEKDEVNLRENVRFYQSITKDGLNVYTIKLNGKENSVDNFKQIFVNFLTFSGSISIKYGGDGFDFRNYVAGNKQYFVIDKNSEGKKMSNLISFFITGEVSSHYAVDYKLIHEDSDKTSMKGESGISYLETIEPKVGSKSVILKNKKTSEKKNFLVNFFSLNCQISVTRIYNNDKQTELEIVDYLAQDVFKREDSPEEYDQGEYQYLMKIEKMDNVTKFDQNWCMIYVSSLEENDFENSPAYKQKQLTVSEGVVTQIILDENFSGVQYIYPHTTPSGYVAINFNIETESKFAVKIFLENKLYDSFNLGKSRYYIIKESEIRSDDYCPITPTRPDQACNVIVEIILDKKFYQEKPLVEFNIKSQEIVPAFVRKSMLRQDIIVGNFYQYYFTEVGKKEEGQVSVNFNRGGGHIFGRLVPKNANEGEGWMGRFILPDEGNNELNYNHYTKKIQFGEYDTEKCDVGCYLLLKVAHNMTDEDFNKEDIAYPISISIHSNDATILTITPDILTSVDVPVNEYIVGSTVPLFINTLLDYYTFFIPYDCEEIIFELESDSCKLHINIGKNKPTKDENDFTFGNLGGDSVFHLKKEDILKKLELENKNDDSSIKNIELTIGVSAQFIDDESSSIYSFRIRPKRKEEIDIIPLTGDQKALCEIIGNHGNCYFLLSHHRKLDENNNFFFYSLEEPNIEYKYFANIIDPEVIFNRDQEEIQNLIPTEQNAKFSSLNMKGNYLYIDYENVKNLTETDNGIYILVNLEVITPKKTETDITIVSLLHTIYNYKGITLPNPTSVQLFSVKANPIKFSFLTENQNIIAHIVSISGASQVFWEDFTRPDNPVYYLNNPGDAIDLTLGLSDSFPLQIISSVSSQVGDPGFGFYIYYKIQSQQENYNQVNFGESSKISFKDADFPFIFYTKIPDTEHEVDFIIKLDSLIIGKIYGDDEEEIEIISGDEFEINGLVTDEETVYEKKGNHYINPPDKNKILGSFDPATKVARIQFTPAKIKKFEIEGNNYLFVILNKAVGNTKNYKEVSMECSVLPSSLDGIFAPINKYNYAKIPVDQEGFSRYELNRVNNQNKYMRIEFATNTGKIGFALNNNNINNKNINSHSLSDIDFYKNNTKIIKEDIYGGKSSLIIEFEQNSTKSVFLSVFNTENQKHLNKQEKLSNFLFRYNLSETNEFTNLRPDSEKVKHIFYKEEKKISMTVPAIKGMFDMLDVNYYVKVLPASDIVKEEKISTIAQVESKTNKIYKKSVINYNKEVDLNLTDMTNDRIYYIEVIAEVFEEDQAQFFAFNSIYNPTEYTPKEDNTGSRTMIWVIIGVSLFVFIAILVFVFLFLRVKKANLRLSQQFNELNSRLQSQNVIIDN